SERCARRGQQAARPPRRSSDLHAATIASLPAGGAALLPVSAPPPWVATVRADRLGASDLVRLTAEVEWRPVAGARFAGRRGTLRSEEHTSELQSRAKIVCRLLL